MKISTNPIGNYAPNYIDRSAAKPQPVEQPKKNETAVLSASEKEYFIKKYPENKADITDYHFYKKGGKMSGVSVGNLFDRRG
jgi:hypothetical protein